jgi:hypothetical protein
MVLSWYFPTGTEGTHKKLSQDSWCPSQNSNWTPPKEVTNITTLANLLGHILGDGQFYLMFLSYPLQLQRSQMHCNIPHQGLGFPLLYRCFCRKGHKGLGFSLLHRCFYRKVCQGLGFSLLHICFCRKGHQGLGLFFKIIHIWSVTLTSI